MRLFFILLLLSTPLCGCVMARDVPEQYFVSQEELKTIALAREGLNYLSEDRYIDAENKLRQALYLAPKTKSLKLNLAAALEGNGQFDEARKIIEPLLAQKSEDDTDLAKLDLLFRLAHLDASRQHWEDAERTYSKIVELAEEIPDYTIAAKATKNLRYLENKLGRKKTALCYAYQTAVYKDDLVSGYDYARLLISYDEPRAAVDFYTLYAVSHNAPKDSHLAHLQALAAFAEGDLKKAYDTETELLKEGSLDTTLIREARIVRILAASDPLVSETIDSENREQLDTLWLEMSESLEVDSREALTWPRPMLEALEKAKAAPDASSAL